MSQIIGGHTFVPLEKNIDDVKLNSITSGATITSELISTQTQTTSAVTNDQFLILKAAGTLARIMYDDLANSLGSATGMVSAITSVRLRSFNAVGNPSFEVDQRNVGNSVTVTPSGSGLPTIDRWAPYIVGTAAGTTQQIAPGVVLVPGTNFCITRYAYRVTLTTAQATLGATDQIQVGQSVEAPYFRELFSDVHSVSLLVRSSVAGLKFGLSLRDSTHVVSLVKLCTISTANTWTLIQLPNIPVWSGTGSYPQAPGNIGYLFVITLAAGTTLTAPANDTWQNGNFLGAVGQSNFAASPVGSTWDIAFCQHEPGSQCTTLIDKPFTRNYDECLRYFQKTYSYSTVPGAVAANGIQAVPQTSATALVGTLKFLKPLATTPNITGYNFSTGAINSFQHTNGTNYTISSALSVGDSGFQGFSTGTMPAVVAGAAGYVHYAADTGW